MSRMQNMRSRRSRVRYWCFSLDIRHHRSLGSRKSWLGPAILEADIDIKFTCSQMCDKFFKATKTIKKLLWTCSKWKKYTSTSGPSQSNLTKSNNENVIKYVNSFRSNKYVDFGTFCMDSSSFWHLKQQKCVLTDFFQNSYFLLLFNIKTPSFSPKVDVQPT